MVLVQRDTLDFIILALPLHIASPDAAAAGVQHPLGAGHLSQGDMGALLAAALNVLLKKDASLNRRLFMWLLGSQTVEAMEGNGSGGPSTVARLALASKAVSL